MLTNEEKTVRAREVVEILRNRYPDAACSLTYDGDPWRLLVMGRLSAQCTDARVNIVCETLFDRYPDAASMAAAPLEEIEKIVFPCGVYRVKAQNIRDFSAILIERFNGVVPSNMEDLLSLPGVGRKIANLILGDIYHLPAVVADTHCIRISGRLGLCESAVPEKVERALSAIVAPKEQSGLCHRFVLFGREVCTARAPSCDVCPFKKYGCIK